MDKYKKDMPISYTFGIFPTIELLKHKSAFVQKVMIHEKLEITLEIQQMLDFCKQHGIVVEFCTKQIEKIVDKESTMVVGVFSKFDAPIERGANHIVLVHPSDMGNLGTIMRTALGFGVKNIAIIAPCVDIFNPKAIRASMGAVFSLNVQIFDSFDDYYAKNSGNHMYPFMLKGEQTLQTLTDKSEPFSLIFGNEGSGLDDSFLTVGTSVVIRHSHDIDSLNLAISVALALYTFVR